LSLGSSCGRSVPKPPPASIVHLRSDSAGPGIVRSPELLVTLPPRGIEPRDFLDLRGVLAFSDGSIAVADAGVPCVYVFDARGKLQSEFGRSGSGPGEFREPRLVAVWADSLAVYDPPQRRLMLFTRAGTFARQTPIPARGPVQILGFLHGGDPVIKQTAFPDSTTSGGLVDAQALLIRVRGDELDTVTTLRDGRWATNGFRFFAWGGVAAITDSTIWTGEGNAPQLKEIAWDGRELRSFRWAGGARPVSEQDRTAMAAISGERQAPPGFIDAPERFADSVPLFGRLLTDPLGGVWVLGYEAPFTPPEGAWRIDDRTGTIAAIRLPPRFRPTQVGVDFLLGVLTDEDGVGQPARFHLAR
jgi:hypothetical protein